MSTRAAAVDSWGLLLSACATASANVKRSCANSADGINSRNTHIRLEKTNPHLPDNRAIKNAPLALTVNEWSKQAERAGLLWT